MRRPNTFLDSAYKSVFYTMIALFSRFSQFFFGEGLYSASCQLRVVSCELSVASWFFLIFCELRAAVGSWFSIISIHSILSF